MLKLNVCNFTFDFLLAVSFVFDIINMLGIKLCLCVMC